MRHRVSPVGKWRAALIAATALLGLPTPLPAQTGKQPAPMDLARRVADWQLKTIDNLGPDKVPEARAPLFWGNAVFWIGMTDVADAAPAGGYADRLRQFGRANKWALGIRPFNADDHVAAQVYLWTILHGEGSQALEPTRKGFDHILANRPNVGLPFHLGPGGYEATECLPRWCWSDALFMAPAAWLDLSRQTGDTRYADYALSEFWASVAFLYDPAEQLFYRDSRFFDRRDDRQRKIFWSRGNGWVLAGLARIIPLLPVESPDRVRMIALFRDMARRVAELQKPDGSWAPSLLATEDSPPESSGTAFFVYALAWGMNNGVLDRASYAPTVERGWQRLVGSVGSDGKLGWVQKVGDRPGSVSAQDSEPYGVGAFLMAATAVARLNACHPSLQRKPKPAAIRC